MFIAGQYISTEKKRYCQVSENVIFSNLYFTEFLVLIFYKFKYKNQIFIF